MWLRAIRHSYHVRRDHQEARHRLVVAEHAHARVEPLEPPLQFERLTPNDVLHDGAARGPVSAAREMVEHDAVHQHRAHHIRHRRLARERRRGARVHLAHHPERVGREAPCAAAAAVALAIGAHARGLDGRRSRQRGLARGGERREVDLAVGERREGAECHNAPRDRVGGKAAAAVLKQIAVGPRRRSLRDEEDELAAALGSHRSELHGRRTRRASACPLPVGARDGLDGLKLDPEAAHLDLPVYAPQEAQVAGGQPHRKVAREVKERARRHAPVGAHLVGERVGHKLGGGEVAPRQVACGDGAAEADLGGHPHRRRAQRAVEKDHDRVVDGGADEHLGRVGVGAPLPRHRALGRAVQIVQPLECTCARTRKAEGKRPGKHAQGKRAGRALGARGAWRAPSAGQSPQGR